jgi:hypothetical protein
MHTENTDIRRSKKWFVYLLTKNMRNDLNTACRILGMLRTQKHGAHSETNKWMDITCRV